MFDPLEELASWREEARRGGALEPDAMVVATATTAATPSARVVLCRGIDACGVSFFTNYESRKGNELSLNPQAAAVFFWPSLGKQVRLEGQVEKLPALESDRYFAQRPRTHRLQSWASPQSRPIADFAGVQARHVEFDSLYRDKEVPRPPWWGGYRLMPAVIELWENGEFRLHSRRVFHREGEGWRLELLAP